ncbi:hypothetical protein [Streptomyces griseocarneus]|uniref:hypothetical protein n=1 Tax=Streptomyces griseocarneus TaxID=51201 RepID=UPI00167D027F|nr:hypothetical protein [Streptomyces griseocarneus]MBZ6473891.1 hypothetical protein [Streptomyces griseocarneus]GHG65758.1 hypothetical protein GCM10018779_36650 [Streptomyces griseocarneus]
MGSNPHWDRLRIVLRRLSGCALSYVLVFAAAWVVIGIAAPRELDPASNSFGRLPFWESVLSYLELGVGMLIIIGIPSLLLILLAGLVRREKDPHGFRVMMAFLLLLPTWPLWFADIPIMFWLQAGAQVVFAACLMPVPLLPDLISNDAGETSAGG